MSDIKGLGNLSTHLLFTQLEIDSRLDEDVAALNVDNAANIHILELFTVLLAHDIQMVTGDLLLNNQVSATEDNRRMKGLGYTSDAEFGILRTNSRYVLSSGKYAVPL
jgi:hypothetical protein